MRIFATSAMLRIRSIALLVTAWLCILCAVAPRVTRAAQIAPGVNASSDTPISREVEHRLTVLETLVRCNSGGTGLLIMETVLRLATGKGLVRKG